MSRPTAPPVRLPVLQTFEGSFEGVVSSDIELTESLVAYGHEIGDWDWQVSVQYKTFREHYEPNPDLFDILDSEAILEESTVGWRAALNRRLLDRLTLKASGGAYNGYDGYRSVWLAHYYDNHFDFVPGYENPDPGGNHGTVGLRWEYLPASGFIEARVGYFNDRVAPGYELDVTGPIPVLVRGEERLQTWSYYGAVENVLSPSIRTRLEFQAMDTTAREWRYSVQGSVNVALGDRWVARVQAGQTDEEPDFVAWFAAATLEWEWTPSLHLGVSARYYRDNGEIEDSLLLSSAAPGLEATQVGVGLRYVWEHASIRVFAGPYFTNYERGEVGTAPFENLYKDRDWTLAQLAFSVQY